MRSSHMKAIVTVTDKARLDTNAGPLPTLKWLRIDDLVIDRTYRTRMHGRGRQKVNRIAGSFRWSCFGTVLVARAGSGKFCIVDGHHRTTAAAILGFEKVPCQIVEAS